MSLLSFVEGTVQCGKQGRRSGRSHSFFGLFPVRRLDTVPSPLAKESALAHRWFEFRLLGSAMWNEMCPEREQETTHDTIANGSTSPINDVSTTGRR